MKAPSFDAKHDCCQHAKKLFYNIFGDESLAILIDFCLSFKKARSSSY